MRVCTTEVNIVLFERFDWFLNLRIASAIHLLAACRGKKWRANPILSENKVTVGIAVKLVLCVLKQVFASVLMNSGGYLPRRSGSVNIDHYSPLHLLHLIICLISLALAFRLQMNAVWLEISEWSWQYTCSLDLNMNSWKSIACAVQYLKFKLPDQVCLPPFSYEEDHAKEKTDKVQTLVPSAN